MKMVVFDLKTFNPKRFCPCRFEAYSYIFILSSGLDLNRMRLILMKFLIYSSSYSENVHLY